MIDALPHGGGIDCSWSIDRLKKGNIVARNSYHVMNKNGYYDGWQDFSIRIYPTETGHDFRLLFTGYRQRKQWACDLRDYLEDSIYLSLDTLFNRTLKG